MKKLTTFTGLVFLILGCMNLFLIFGPSNAAMARAGWGLMFVGIGLGLLVITKLPIFNKKKVVVGPKLKKDAKFEAIYEELHKLHDETLKQSEKKLKTSNTLFMILGAFFLSIIGLMLFEEGRNLISIYTTTFAGIPVIVLIAAIVMLYFALTFQTGYTKQYKSTVVKDLISKTNPNLTFSSSVIDGGRELTRHYEMANLDKFAKVDIGLMFSGVRQYVESNTEDYIEGRLADGISVKMAEIKVEEVKRTEQETRRNLVFNGLFTHINMVNASPVEVGIFLNQFDPNKRSARKEGKPILLAKEGWKKVTVYSDDGDKVKEFLSEELGKIVSAYDKDISVRTDILLRGNDVYMRFHENHFFEPSADDTERNKRRLYTYYRILTFIDDFAKELDNTIVKTKTKAKKAKAEENLDKLIDALTPDKKD